MRFVAIRASALVSFFLGFCLCTASVLAINNSPEALQARATLQSKASGGRLVQVIVTLKEPAVAGKAQAFGLTAAAADRSAFVAGLHQKLLAKFPNVANRAQTQQFKYTPHLVLAVNTDELQALINDPDVEDVVENRPSRIAMRESVPLVNAPKVWSGGNVGSGQAVAVLDSGVAGYINELNGKVYDGGCSSNAWYVNGVEQVKTMCFDGHLIYPTGGGNCDPGVAGCQHGTQVASIVAADSGWLDGVAKGARIVSVQIFAWGMTRDVCNQPNEAVPCIRTYDSNVAYGLQRVYDIALQGRAPMLPSENLVLLQNGIAAVNLSIQGDLYSSACDSVSPSVTAQINLLKSIGIPTIVASGNSGSTNAISWPACISSVISVGATSKNRYSEIAAYSNSSSQLNLLAPGGIYDKGNEALGILTYAPIVGSYVTKYDVGTSFAAPHVAGAFALLKARKPTATIDEILNVLKFTGAPVTDARNSLTQPFIQLDAAANFFIKPISVVSSGFNQAHTISWGGSADGLGLSGFTLTVDGVSYSLGNSTTSYQVSLTPVVNHVISVVAHDTRGHTSTPVSTNYSYNDVVAPTTPTVSVSKVGPVISDAAHTVSWTAASDNVGVAGYVLTVDGVATGLLPANQLSASYSLSPNTVHTVSVVAKDAAGNTSAAGTKSYSYDTIAPSQPGSVSVVKLSPGTSSTSVRIAWGASADAVGVVAYRLKVDGVEQFLPQAWATQFDTNLSVNVNHTIAVSALDAARNESTAVTATFMPTDTVKPAVPTGVTFTKLSASNANFQHKLQWNASSDDVGVARYKVLIYAGSYTGWNATIDVGLNTSYTLDLMPNTNYSVAIAAYDAAGNVGTMSYAAFSYAGTCSPGASGSGLGSLSASASVGLYPPLAYANGSLFTSPGTLPNNFVNRVTLSAVGPQGAAVIASSCGLSVSAARAKSYAQAGYSGVMSYTATVCDRFGRCVSNNVNNPSWSCNPTTGACTNL